MNIEPSGFRIEGRIRRLMASTWSWGARANRAGKRALALGQCVEAVELACVEAEADPANHTVGAGGFPDASGRVSLDAGIMERPDRHGAVACVRRVVHPIRLARAVMDRSNCRLLVGTDADDFAHELGLASEVELSEKARRAYEDFRAGRASFPLANLEEQYDRLKVDEPSTHDTIGVIAWSQGTMAAGTSTSGLAFKRPGRVGDSPIVGAGFYCDPEAGACVCTGRGELLLGVSAAHLAVENLRRGDGAIQAARLVIERLAATHTLGPDDQAAVLVVSNRGECGAASVMKGYTTSLLWEDVSHVWREKRVEANFVLRPEVYRAE
jgi:isoaspartyl peptidase/L-asparaginase-like protein (Ntn-hydrolase superfamily)